MITLSSDFYNKKKIFTLSVNLNFQSFSDRLGDCELAIETRRKLLADGNATESKEFRRQFESLLEKHKVPLPEDFGTEGKV